MTHEQADFDAIASLLGAHLMDEDAFPVLPGKMNRNVHAFITLYGADLPFVERRDLPSEPVEAVTLVDTQSLVSVKGMSPETAVRVIDHHPLRLDLPQHWTVNSEETGANATLFVEGMREVNGLLNMIHATLLLIGIYEDTGSLTYARTTGRDLRAAAFLLEQGASLRIVSNYLNHPLTQPQQDLYDRLRKQARNISIHGYTIVVSCVEAGEMDEEFSTVVHKLRDFLDPDALIVLIAARSGVQLIARSTSDNIDVAEIAGYFGGGGHTRASAGLIKDRTLEDVCVELVEILERQVRPAVTVAQIMSRGPQVLSPDTKAEEAALRMQRYGYEGYPVVDGGKVIGLLTRRDVDRAISHKLNLRAASLMDAGEVVVGPDDSIEHLQRIMTETGWGQVPVINRETGQIIGIVTRTDLLKILTPEAKTSGRQNYANRLESALPTARLDLIRAIAENAHEMHIAFYIVGGFVRDLLLDRPGIDFDLVVEGDAIALAYSLAKKYGGRVTSHARFGTAKWFVHGWQAGVDLQDLPPYVDLITARTEFYTHPTALPTVEQGSIKLDLHRRDFTINTLALRLDGHHYGELHDYWGGLNDLRLGLVRCLHSLSFVDDPTRMLRAVRFEQRFSFTIEERTLQLLQEAITLLDRVSGDRIRHELDHILDEERAAPMLRRLNELGLLSAIHPALAWDDWLNCRLEGLVKSEIDLDPDVWDLPVRDDDMEKKSSLAGSGHGDFPQRYWLEGKWSGIPVRRVLAYALLVLRLPAAAARLVLARLKVSRSLTSVILAANALWSDLGSLINQPPSKVVKRLEDVPPLALVTVFLAASEQAQKDLVFRYASQWRKQVPTITGHDLRARGLPPGPRYAQLLASLRAAWLDGEIHTQREEMDLLEKLIHEN